MTISTPRASALTWGFWADAAEDDGLAQVHMLAVGAELVGDLDRQLAGRGEHERARFARQGPAGPRESLCRMGSAKAAVLPVPVWAMPNMSRPARSSGMAAAWIGVGVMCFLEVKARWIGSARPNSAKLLMFT